ncbi:ABC-2 type transport system ATP-binding protein [Halopolyspora algeriensis]|uniref:ABC-2 type transport system ATP-binding protein n=1 Tax=Halopolyspora algeriensis TaxID=1500506 RepID=A0A368VBI4_9ACTN|nr:ABC transporter ATP-binding protein [Halopolyspora algeriensis]RCW38529.1 ABC-2 type transport system ATP-binding protein [Halopolyspora algeriensis]TQM42610.1 ABC-2 type transport system ATP-binding protein [Halopolyspora algeriensis]
MTPAVEVLDLVKRYPKSSSNAVDNLSFEVHPGEVFGLLGPNGAGKTTTVGILTTRVTLTAGTARIGGVSVGSDPVAARRKVAVVPQQVNLDRSLNARQNLIFHAAYHGVPRTERRRLADELLDRMGLTDKAKARIDDLSGGQAQRLMIARALIHRPEVLFLDEPSTGLDPQARLFVHDRVSGLRSEGVTVVLTTHDMDEAEKLSDRVGIVDHGRMLTLDTPEKLIKSLPGSGTIDATVHPNGFTPDGLTDVLAAVQGVEQVEPVGTVPSQTGEDPGLRMRLYVADEPAALLGPVAAALHERQVTVNDLSLGSATLEDVFIDLTGRELR